MLNRIYIGFASIVCTAYAGAALLGWEISDTEKGQVPISVRQSPGGYRSHFWSSGFRGGK